jgi:N-methylhydantoinase B
VVYNGPEVRTLEDVVSVELRRIDPVTVEVLRNALPAIADEMSVDLQRTAYNMMIYEVRDYCCGILDPQGRLVAQNIGGVSHFVADLGVVVKDGIRRYGLDGFAPGDVIITNHQRVAGQHLNNICIYTPFFHDGELCAFPIVRAHWVDVGGQSTGFGAGDQVPDPWAEGLQLDQIKIYEGGVPNETLLRLLCDNIRFPESSMGDMRGQIAACTLAQRHLSDLYRRYGTETIQEATEEIFDQTERRCRLAVDELPDGTYEADSVYDNDGVELDKPVEVKVRVMVSGSDMTIDLTGCSLERKGGINARTLAAPYIAYKAFTQPLDPVNEGSFRALTVDIQEGNFMMARFPAPMSGWSRVLSTVVDTIVKALSRAVPHRAPAAHFGLVGHSLSFFGRDSVSGRRFLMQTAEGGGWGARPGVDGESASVSVCQGDVRNSPIETIELKAPVRVESRALRPDSGGAGEFRGGLGMDIRMRNLVEGAWTLSNRGRRRQPPWGLFGGGDGATAESFAQETGAPEMRREDPARKVMPAGSLVILRSAGGGGWGDPFARDSARVRADVLEGHVSIAAAAHDYGVVIDPTTFAVDEAATRTLRPRDALAAKEK